MACSRFGWSTESAGAVSVLPSRPLPSLVVPRPQYFALIPIGATTPSSTLFTAQSLQGEEDKMGLGDGVNSKCKSQKWLKQFDNTISLTDFHSLVPIFWCNGRRWNPVPHHAHREPSVYLGMYTKHEPTSLRNLFFLTVNCRCQCFPPGKGAQGQGEQLEVIRRQNHECGDPSITWSDMFGQTPMVASCVARCPQPELMLPHSDKSSRKHALSSKLSCRSRCPPPPPLLLRLPATKTTSHMSGMREMVCRMLDCLPAQQLRLAAQAPAFGSRGQTIWSATRFV